MSQTKWKTWVCPKCGNAFKTELELSEPPTCYNHNGKVYKMTKKS